MPRFQPTKSLRATVWLFLGLLCSASALLAAPKLESVPLWQRYEHEFKSGPKYSRFPAAIEFQVEFVAPSGLTNSVFGFWNGGREWLVRFAPNELGRWHYTTHCSPNNIGLNQLSGDFLCVAASGTNALAQTGPLVLNREHHTLEHFDHSPFVWCSDVACVSPSRVLREDWQTYVESRSADKFTVIQWLATGVVDEHDPAALAVGQLDLDLAQIKKLDARIAAVAHAGLLNAIVPFSEINFGDTNSFPLLSETQTLQLGRYLIARWSTERVAWILPVAGTHTRTWKRLGRELFAGVSSPVIVFCGQDYWALNDFREEPWVAGLGYQTGPTNSDDRLEWLIAGPLAADSAQPGALPYFDLLPPLDELADGNLESPVNGLDARRAAAFSAMLTPTPSFSYGARDVWSQPSAKSVHYASGGSNSAWLHVLDLPAAHQLQFVAELFHSLNGVSLRPHPKLVFNQSGEKSPAHFICAAMSPQRDFAVLYIPSSRVVELDGREFSAPSEANWFNPRTGVKSPAEFVPYIKNVRVTTPEPGDWFLTFKAKPVN